MKNTIYVLVLLSLIFNSCNTKNKKEDKITTAKSDSINIKYAKGFRVTEFDNYKLIDVQDPLGENDLKYKYAFLDRGKSKEGIPSDYQIIEVPVQSVICMTTLQISNFIKLGKIDKIKGITSIRFLFNEQLKKQLKEGKTNKIGIEGEFDKEMVIAINPDVILTSPFKRGGYDTVRDLDIPLVSFLGYKETSALGQAEWIKFTGMLLGTEDLANKLFEEIESKYKDLESIAAKATNKPSVMTGELHSGNWYVMGGNSYQAEQFRDAGASYFMKNDNESGGFYVDFETVYSQGANTDYWRIINSFDGTYTYDDLNASDARYADFKAFKDKKVIYCNLRDKPFYENTPVEPEVVLADLIKIFHPELLPNHTPVYYDVLK